MISELYLSYYSLLAVTVINQLHYIVSISYTSLYKTEVTMVTKEIMYTCRKSNKPVQQLNVYLGVQKQTWRKPPWTISDIA